MSDTYNQKKWTKSEENFLKENYNKMSNWDIASALKRTYSSIEKKSHRLSLYKNYVEPTLENVIGKEKERLNIKDKDKLLNELIKEKASMEIIVEILRDVVPRADYSYKKFKAFKPNPKEQKIVVQCNDVHLGRYTVEELDRKCDIFYDAILSVTETQRTAIPINELVIVFNGDIVDGDKVFSSQSYEQKFFLMEQIFTYGMPRFTNILNRLSDHFSKVTVYTAPGNHGRKDSKRKEGDKRLNFDNIFYEALKLATSENKKIDWHIDWGWYQVADIMGYKFLMTHGANIRSWLNIPFYGIIQKGMRWQGSLPQNWDYLLLGHFHTSLNFKWNNFKTFMSGTWLDNDDYALEELGMDSSTEQTILGVSAKRGVTWKYDINLKG